MRQFDRWTDPRPHRAPGAAPASAVGYTWDLYLNVESPGGRASFDEYLATWPDLEHVADVGDDAVLDAGNLLVAVKADTRIDVQYVNFIDPDAEEVLIELARAIAEGF